MSGFKVWNGSAFVDAQPWIWNGSAFVRPSGVYRWDGTKFVKIWPTFVKQKMNKSGSYLNSNSTNALVTTWLSDSEFPSTITADSLIVQGAQAGALVKLNYNMQSSSGTGDRILGVHKNGVELDRGILRLGTTAVQGFLGMITDLANGDDLEVRIFSGNTRVFDAVTYLSVSPLVQSVRIDKSGVYAFESTGYKTITGWTPNGTYPGTVQTDGLRVPATASNWCVQAEIQPAGLNSSFGANTFRIAVNGVQLGTTYARISNDVIRVGLADQTLNEGDVITLQVDRANSGGSVTSGYIQLFRD
ncbi:minor tail protein [Gordonia phage Suzy]|uniref:Minor tail protein n=1 Tax=Gordonia phage Suzy TaxID=2201430 RepID=A0A2Z4Q9D3_9CAUD|nr:minor tail protein [Gordonia phage Suzy]AWY06133.1 minor tail protein [Gordonia phage Suzy]